MHLFSSVVIADLEIKPADQTPHLRFHQRLISNLASDPFGCSVENLTQHHRVATAGDRWLDTLQHVFEKGRNLAASGFFRLRFETRLALAAQRITDDEQTDDEQSRHYGNRPEEDFVSRYHFAKPVMPAGWTR